MEKLRRGQIWRASSSADSYANYELVDDIGKRGILLEASNPGSQKMIGEVRGITLHQGVGHWALIKDAPWAICAECGELAELDDYLCSACRGSL
jgi:hypothetical protein